MSSYVSTLVKFIGSRVNENIYVMFSSEFDMRSIFCESENLTD